MKFTLISFCILSTLFSCGKAKRKQSPSETREPTRITEGTAASRSAAGLGGESQAQSAPATVVPAQKKEESEQPPLGCDKSLVGITQAKLLSTGIKRHAKFQTLRYELSVMSCKDGTAVALNNLPVQFDLNARFSDLNQTIAFAIKNASNLEIHEGILNPVPGEDLFGNSGNYAYWTTPSLSYASTLEKLILEVNLTEQQIDSYAADAASIDSYLKIGNALVVTQVLLIID